MPSEAQVNSPKAFPAKRAKCISIQAKAVNQRKEYVPWMKSNCLTNMERGKIPLCCKSN